MTDAIKLTVQRVEKYIAERAKMRGLDQELIHGLHSDDPREAELLVSDLAAMVAALRAQPDHIVDASEMVDHRELVKRLRERAMWKDDAVISVLLDKAADALEGKAIGETK